MDDSSLSTVNVHEDYLQRVVRVMAHWGFAVLQPVHSRSPGFHILAVAMRTTPTYAHFDPEALAIPIFGFGQQATEIIWHRQSVVPKLVSVYPGSICVTDRVRKQVNFYSYGGSLRTLHDDSGGTLYVITSTAPILSLGTQVTLALEDQLATETEALMARLRAAALCRGVDLASRLAEHDPLMLYAGCITSILESYSKSRMLVRMFPDMYDLAKRESVWLADQPGVRRAPLEQMVGLTLAGAPTV